MSDKRDETEWTTFRRIVKQARRLMTLGVKAGKPWNAATTAGEIAKAVKLAPEEVVRLILSHGWWIAVEEVGGVPCADWIVWEDGE